MKHHSVSSKGFLPSSGSRSAPETSDACCGSDGLFRVFLVYLMMPGLILKLLHQKGITPARKVVIGGRRNQCR